MNNNHNNHNTKNNKNIINKYKDNSNNNIFPLLLPHFKNNRKLSLLDISRNEIKDNLLLFTTTNKYNRQTKKRRPSNTSKSRQHLTSQNLRK